MGRGIRAEDGSVSRKIRRKYLVRGGAMETLEGDGTLPSLMVVLEFPSMEQARAWYNDADYAPMIQLRQSGSDLDFVLVDGL